jgi:hypothetical protein
MLFSFSLLFCRPFFDKITVDFPAAEKPLVVTAKGAGTKNYIKSVTVNGISIQNSPIIRHEDIANGGEIVFEMTDAVEEAFASSTVQVTSTVRVYWNRLANVLLTTMMVAGRIAELSQWVGRAVTNAYKILSS